MFTFDQAKYWLSHRNELKKKLKDVFSIYDNFGDTRNEWGKFYKTHFEWDVDFSQVLLPEKPGEEWRLIFIAKGMTMNKAFARCKKLFATWQYSDDLDKAVPKNARVASDHYAVWVWDGVEPEVRYLGKSTHSVDPDMKLGITVLERIILEIKYFSETGNHLDIKGVTLCSGSRSSDGCVPFAYWYGGKFRVRCYGLGVSDSAHGVRSAVSL